MQTSDAVAGRHSRVWLAIFTLVVAAVLLAACAPQLVPVDEQPTGDAAGAARADSTPTEAAPEEAAGAAEPATVTVAPVSGEPELVEGIPVGFTVDGHPYRGSPDAPVVMFEYSDFQCPFCQRYFVQTEPALNEAYVRDGTLRVVFRDFPLVQLHPNAPMAHEASLCVADQGAALYWDMHNEIFRTQTDWAQNPDAAGFFAGLAEQVGADMDLYTACMDGGANQALVKARVDEAIAKGFSGTPSFEFVNAATGEAFNLVGAQPYDSFAGFVDAVAAGESPAGAEPAADSGGEEQGIPFWATAEGLTPDSDRPGYTTAGDFYHGNPEAEVVVIEFSDFQCPYCRRHAETTQPELDKLYVDTDKVMWVFKHFPLSIHPQAPQAGAGAECAAEQGKFWEMKSVLYETSSQWGVSDPIPELISVAADADIGLDMDQFEACINSDEASAAVESDLNDGAPFVRGTPTFIVLFSEQGRIIPGALPLEQFTELIDQVLAESETP